MQTDRDEPNDAALFSVLRFKLVFFFHSREKKKKKKKKLFGYSEDGPTTFGEEKRRFLA